MSEIKYSQLAHYTSYEGLEGILREGFRFYSADGMNDDQELLCGFGVMENYFNCKLKDHPNVEVTSEKIIRSLKCFKESDFFKGFFLASFCEIDNEKDADEEKKYNEENGLLSMFRGYGKDGGYVIKFNKEKLTDLFKKMVKGDEDTFISISSKVQYENPKIIKGNVEDVFQKIGEQFKREGYIGPDLDIKEKLEGFCQNLLEKKDFQNLITNVKKYFKDEWKAPLAFIISVIFIKHYGFHEEREYRFAVAAAREDTQFPINFDNKDGKIKSYIKVFSEKENLEEFTDCIEEILIGPSMHKDHNKRKVEELLLAKFPKRQKSYNKIKVVASETPYIG